MTHTHWLIAVIIIVILALLAALYLHGRRAAAQAALDYRTINASTMESDVRAIRAQVPDAPSRNRLRAGPLAASHLLQGTQAQVRAQAITAALRDIGKGTSTPNPYRQGSAAHTTWAQHYERLISDQKSLQEV